MANVGPHVWYVRDNAPTSTIGWSAVTAWHQPWTPAAGVLCRQSATPTVGNERVFVCIVSGAVGGTEPATWVVTKGGKTTDSSATWQECTGQPGVNGDLTNCPTWLQNKNTGVTLGMIIQNGAGTYLFICTTAGNTGTGSEPSWTLTAGVATTDNTAHWTCMGAVGGFGAYAAPHARLANSLASTWAANGDAIFVGDDHAETQASNLTITSGTAAIPTYVYCMDHTVVPPSTANLKTTASITTTGTTDLVWGNTSNTGMYVNGITASCGTGSGSTQMTFGVASNNTNLLVFENCAFSILTTGVTTFYYWGTNARSNKLRFINTTFGFNATNPSINVTSSDCLWKNTPSAIQGTVPTNLFTTNTAPPGNLVCDGVDLSALGSGNTIWNQGGGGNGLRLLLIDCKLNSLVTPAAVDLPGSTADFIRCSSSPNDYDIKSYRYEGTLLSNTAVVRTGGASDGTTPISYTITTTANSLWVNPFEALPITIWNTTTGSNRTITLYGIANTASLPNNDQIWFDVEYQGSASSPMASFQTGSKTNNLATGSALTADTSAWDTQATARTNTTAYVVGNIISVSSNTGRLFFCTVSGTSAGSLPGGYATAVDGGTVTDSGATFRAGWRFSQAVVLSSPQPQIAGYIRVIVKAALASTSFFIDPLPVLS